MTHKTKFFITLISLAFLMFLAVGFVIAISKDMSNEAKYDGTPTPQSNVNKTSDNNLPLPLVNDMGTPVSLLTPSSTSSATMTLPVTQVPLPINTSTITLPAATNTPQPTENLQTPTSTNSPYPNDPTAVIPSPTAVSTTSPNNTPLPSSTPQPSVATTQTVVPTATSPTAVPPTQQPPANTSTPQPTTTPTQTPTAVVTSTQTPTPQPTATSTAVATQTPQPTATSTAVPTSTPTAPPPTMTPTMTATNTPEPTATTPPSYGSCPASAGNGRYIIDFNTQMIRSDWSEADATLGPLAAAIPAGSYRISLVSYDFDHDPFDAAQQPSESWYLILQDASDTIIFESAPTGDLADESVQQTFIVADEVAILTAVTSGLARHATYPDDSVPNSIYPVCAILESQGENPATPIATVLFEGDVKTSVASTVVPAE